MPNTTDTATLHYLELITDNTAGVNSRMAYRTWGNPQAKNLLICVHGLSRQSHDFDILVAALQLDPAFENTYFVSTDVVGRGESDYLHDALSYQLPVYVAHHLSLLASLESKATYARIDWLGTSMGGLIGMGVAATAAAGMAPSIHKLILNDVGPRIAYSGISRISEYVGKHMLFDTEDAAIAHLNGLSVSFGLHTEAEWRRFQKPMLRPRTDGKAGVRLHYDPRIVEPLLLATPELAVQGEAMLWQTFDRIEAHILLLRGADSDLLSAETAAEMRQHQPTMQFHEFTAVGHAPSLQHRDQIDVVRRFLQG